ncbi:helix-turn-helix domain-containing protein [Spirosoma sp. BT702]|uniref:Helix-turn-helix domain-containing protein n=1 Tax=Spirosoma profusum TaxID=2771354 RepID=A0A926Y4M3_9BACT|nr:helix-turn-helix transcriptional regulator [Spirosoma profusum]MBD2703281.1 helix-turn-helix domain-containing protein [Spirosoma profusum]
MTTDDAFPAISPKMSQDLFLIRDASWDERFKENFNQFIISRLETSWRVIKLPLPPSRTSNHALFFVTSGQMEVSIGHQTYTVGPQSLVIVPALQIFTIQTISADSTGFMCFVSQEMIRSAVDESDFAFLKLTGHPFVTLSAQQTTFINNLLSRLTVEYLENGAAKTDLIPPYLLVLLTEINRAYAGTFPIKTDASDRLVQRFMDLLTTQIRQSRLTTTYAEQLNVSPNHLNKVIKFRTGKSPSVWIDERIVLEAKVLLFQSDLTVSQVAQQLGFDDQSSFGKLFRKYAQVSPTEFRNHYVRPND